MTKIWDRLYLGSFKDAEQLATTNPHRIRAVVSLCEEEVPRASNILCAPADFRCSSHCNGEVRRNHDRHGAGLAEAEPVRSLPRGGRVVHPSWLLCGFSAVAT